VSTLEHDLRALSIEWPETPDLAGAVEARLGGSAPARRRPWRPLVAVALAALAVSAGAVLAFSPGARSALLELFRIKGATVTRVEELPDVGEAGELELGEPVSLSVARDGVFFRIRQPGGEEVDRVYLDRRIGTGAVSMVWCCPQIVLMQFRGAATPYAEKQAGPGTRVEHLFVGDKAGVWISGARHVVVFRDDLGQIQEKPRLARNVLLWEDGDVTLRLEGDITKQRALAIARQIG
jgi:hypothetical protein